jgi:hypothetical protein
MVLPHSERLGYGLKEKYHLQIIDLHEVDYLQKKRFQNLTQIRKQHYFNLTTAAF